MNKIKAFISGATVLALPVVTQAQFTAEGGDGGPLEEFIVTLVEFINGILIPAILALAFLVFVWGVFKYFVAGGADDDAKEKGKSLMIYAIAGFVLILIFFGVVNFFTNTIGLGGGEIVTPVGPVPEGGTAN